MRTAVMARVDLLLAAPPFQRAVVRAHAAPLAMVRLQALACVARNAFGGRSREREVVHGGSTVGCEVKIMADARHLRKAVL